MQSKKFDAFVQALDHAVNGAERTEADILKDTEALVRDLVSTDDWLPDAYAQPHPDYYQQYCLHACPRDTFSVVSFVWGPGQHTPVHDHTVWGVIGMLRGSETAERYVRQPDGTYASVGVDTLTPGMTDCVSPAIGDVHKVSNALDDQVSISIHVYGANIGKVERHVFVPDTGEVKSFVSGYAQPQA